MPEIFEGLLWCIALATWLMLFGAYACNGIRPLIQTIGGLVAWLKQKN